MNKIAYRIVGLIMILTLTVSVPMTGDAMSDAAVMEAATVNIAHFYKPPQGMNATAAARHFNFIVLTNGDQDYMNALRAAGFTPTIAEYFRFEAIQDPGSCTANPLNNQVAYQVGDFCNISANHPDWFLLDNNGNRTVVADTPNYYRMDPSNSGWREFFLDRVIESQAEHGWSGLFLDNVEASLGKFYGNPPARYPTDEQYQEAVADFLQYLDSNYSQRFDRPIIGNIVTRRDNDQATWFSYLRYLDAAMQERFAVNWNERQYLSQEKWLQDLELMEETQARGEYVILVAPGYRSNAVRQKFAFASYLLINQGKAAFRYSTAGSYRQAWLYNNYNVNLGLPLGPRYQQNGTWRRDFERGYVTVNPVRHRAAIVVTGGSAPTPNPTAEPAPTNGGGGGGGGPLPTGTIYDNNDAAFTYSGSWEDASTSRSIQGSFERARQVGASATLAFNGQRFTVVYKTSSNFGMLDVYVDGNFVASINQRSGDPQFRQQWSYPGSLSAGTHELKLVFSGPAGSKASLDAVIVP